MTIAAGQVYVRVLVRVLYAFLYAPLLLGGVQRTSDSHRFEEMNDDE